MIIAPFGVVCQHLKGVFICLAKRNAKKSAPQCAWSTPIPLQSRSDSSRQNSAGLAPNAITAVVTTEPALSRNIFRKTATTSSGIATNAIAHGIISRLPQNSSSIITSTTKANSLTPTTFQKLSKQLPNCSASSLTKTAKFTARTPQAP